MGFFFFFYEYGYFELLEHKNKKCRSLRSLAIDTYSTAAKGLRSYYFSEDYSKSAYLS